ncbi:hypothetical protein [Gorillibacterium massiliense]|uniref:hypothetical protein n=1 Tax=Gorillibacterium massiliense TaxID=1280390 RepID=UPI0004AE2C81|nr:hypothetical protein [Gorillibacterium massiliense]
MGSCTWTGQALTDNWDNQKNWDPQQVPQDMDDIIIPGRPTAKNQGPVVPKEMRVRNLTLSGDCYLSGSKLSVAETFTFESGTLNTNVEIESGGKLSCSGSTNKNVRAITITNNGTISMEGGKILMSEGAVIRNLNRVECTSSTELFWLAGVPVTFENNGILSVRNGLVPVFSDTTMTMNGVGLINKGRISVDSGILQLDGPGGKHRLLHGSSITCGGGDARVRVSDGGVAVVEGVVMVDAIGVFEIGENGSLSDIAVPAGSPLPLLDCNGTLLWSGGTLSVDVKLEQTGRLKTVGVPIKFMYDNIIDNYGTIDFTDETNMQFGGGGKIVNHSLLQFHHNANLKFGYGKGGSIDNQGTMKLLAMNASSQEFPRVSFSDVGFQSSSAVNLEAGQLRFEIGAYTLKQGASFTGQGKVVLAGGTLSLEGDATVSAETTFELTNKGMLNLTSTTTVPKKQMIVSGQFLWSGGTLKSQLTLNEASTCRISGDKDKYLYEGVIVNSGLVTWQGTGTLALGGGGKFTNTLKGRLTSEENVRMYWSYGSTPVFENRGSIEVTGGMMLMDSMTLSNYGSINIGPGQLKFQGSGTFQQQDGTVRLIDGTLASVGTGPLLFLNNGVICGSGTVDGTLQHAGGSISPGYDIYGGLIRITGNYNQLADACELFFSISGILAEAGYSILNVTGKATLRGGMSLPLGDGYSPEDGDTFPVLQFGSVQGRFRKVNRPYFQTDHTLIETYGATAVTLEAVTPVILATRLGANASVTLATRHDSGIVDNAFAVQNIADTAQGLPASLSQYGNAPGGTVSLATHLLVGMSVLAQTNSYSVVEIAGGSHSTASRHYQGVAFDINELNGRHIGATHPTFRAFMQACRDLGATEVLGPGDTNHETHVHAAWPVGSV